ncbi:MAG: hypothetical protein GX765_05745 [Candidatus Moranbacteria bacterium]|nr:hypothetical protein [Candidatus Moranbacteria bacterium]
MEFIRKFININKEDVALAGGKGASLGEMTRIGIPVPSGFVILSSSFEKFLTENSLRKKIDLILSGVNNKNIRSIELASEKIRKLILKATFPGDILIEIKKYFDDLGLTFVAVRSSATAEDSASTAWAGQLESYLNTDEKKLFENIKKCWASLFTARAISYRFENNLDKQNISVAVVVQKMVESVKSGVAFSIHPVTQNKNQIIIEAGFGLGEAVVSGQITPDSYVVNKQNFSTSSVVVKNQTKALCRKSSGGNEWKKIKEKGKKQVLSSEEITELAKLISKIEKHYGFAVDIEWAIEKDRLYIIQSRPITTLSLPRQEYRKIMTRPQNLIDCECWDEGERLMLPKKFKDLIFFDPLFIYVQNKAVTIYYNFTDPEQNLQPLIDFLEKNYSWIKREKIDFDNNCQKIREILKNKLNDHIELHKLIKEIWPLIAVANVLGSTEFFKVSKRLRSLCIIVRNESDDVLHPAINYLTKLVSVLIPDKKFINQILYSEFEKNIIPSRAELEKRNNGWLYHKGKIVYDFEKYYQKNNIEIVNPSKHFKNKITGDIACKGFARGRVRVVFELSDLRKIKEGDVIVTPMTTPEMVPVLKKVSAIITDEGGITCHASIISRELKVPCIIGTVSATQILNNGALVEVDASSGVVKILKIKQ